MFRWARRIITFFSFILFAASAAMCVRSYRQVDFVSHQHANRSGAFLTLDERLLVSGRGGACLGIRHTRSTLADSEMTEEQIANLRTSFHHELLTSAGYGGDLFKSTGQPIRFGFGYGKIDSTVNGVTETGRLIIFPWGAAMFVLAILPFIGTVRLIIRHRRLRRLAALNYNGMQTRRMAA
jgi:hypothetical protein